MFYSFTSGKRSHDGGDGSSERNAPTGSDISRKRRKQSPTDADDDAPSLQNPPSYACPLFRYDPVVHHECLMLKLPAPWAVRHHLQRRHSSDQRCPTCGSYFTSRRKLKAHQEQKQPCRAMPLERHYHDLGPERLAQLSTFDKKTRFMDKPAQWSWIWGVVCPKPDQPPPPNMYLDGMLGEMLSVGLEARDRGISWLPQLLEVHGVSIKHRDTLCEKIRDIFLGARPEQDIGNAANTVVIRARSQIQPLLTKAGISDVDGALAGEILALFFGDGAKRDPLAIPSLTHLPRPAAARKLNWAWIDSDNDDDDDDDGSVNPMRRHLMPMPFTTTTTSTKTEGVEWDMAESAGPPEPGLAIHMQPETTEWYNYMRAIYTSTSTDLPQYDFTFVGIDADDEREKGNDDRDKGKFPIKPSVQNLREALRSRDRQELHDLLNACFGHVASEEYSWLAELRSLGYSSSDIADELLEREVCGPWIFQPVVLPFARQLMDGHHQPRCVHNFDQAQSSTNPDTQEGTESMLLAEYVHGNHPTLTPQQSIEYLCGLCGVRPSADGRSETDLGSVTFETSSQAIIKFSDMASHTSEILKNLANAAGMLQMLGGCCSSLTFLYWRYDDITLHRVPFSVIGRLQQSLSNPTALSVFDALYEAMPFFDNGVLLVQKLGHANVRLLVDLAARFLSLCFLSYAQGHRGPISPFFLDTPLETVLLASSTTPTPTLCGSLVESTCIGDMVGGPLFAFHLETGWKKSIDQWLECTPDSKLDLLACAEDVLDTWGPGEALMSKDKPDELLAISIGGGTIVAVEPTPSENSGETPPLLHWSSGSILPSSLPRGFGFQEVVRIGATVMENLGCVGRPSERLRRFPSLLRDLGVRPASWEPSERQLGLGFHAQAAQSGFAIARFNQNWIKMKEVTKKAALLARPRLYTPDLDSRIGVQISVCTGIARRVRLRDLLADVLPAYVAGLVTKPQVWDVLDRTHDITASLQGDNDLGCWLANLTHGQQRAFEDLVRDVLSLLRDTGFNRRDQEFTVACIQPRLHPQCFKIPCKEENVWTRLLADSEDTATFAYATTRCLETAKVKCSNPAAPWINSTSMLSTVVSCCEGRIATTPPAPPSTPPKSPFLPLQLPPTPPPLLPTLSAVLPTLQATSSTLATLPPTPSAGPSTAAGSGSSPGEVAVIAAPVPVHWTLKHRESYYIGHPDALLLVSVHKPEEQREPTLLVSPSTIPGMRLRRLLNGGPGKRKPLRLREMALYDEVSVTESVVVLVGRPEEGGIST
ncbi:hypothetical protein RB593_010126 [Gaeumannomyces tritici]